MGNPNYKQIEISKIHRASDRKKRKCILNGCNNYAINSHLLQRNGILNNISENGHLIERRIIDANQFIRNEPPFEFKKVGLKNALSKPLLCSHHDSEIFKDIENGQTDFESYHSHLLLSYRITLAEIRTKEIAAEKFRNILNSSVLSGKFTRFPIESTLKGFEYGINDLRYFISLLEKEFNSNERNFVFESTSHPLIKVYGSAVFTPDKTFSIDAEDPNVPYEQIYIHVLPLRSELKIITGFHRDYEDNYVRKFVNRWTMIKRKNRLGVELTKLFCDRIENWGLSPEVYRRMDKEKLNRFNKQAQKTLYFPDIFSNNLNIFSNENHI